MKKIFILLLVGLVANIAHAQIYNTGNTLKSGKFALALEPAVMVGGPSDDLNMYFFGGYGIKPGIDLGLRFGVGHTPYFGGFLKWRLGSYAAVTTGVHNFSDFGLDGSLIFNIPVTGDTRINTGIDMDIVFAPDKILVPLWLPVGVEIGLKPRLAFNLESEIALNIPAYHIVSGGLIFTF
ncbi:MAG TPA: hypothetical protein VE912_19170 [Bacteroidales bacterium]|nr:hypothetical protein [Bacteroidales bacterium]